MDLVHLGFIRHSVCVFPGLDLWNASIENVLALVVLSDQSVRFEEDEGPMLI